MRTRHACASGAAGAVLLLLLGASSAASAAGGRTAKAVRAPVPEADEADPAPKRIATQQAIVARIAAVEEKQQVFLVQLELSIAKNAFFAMRDAAAAMVDADGDVQQVEVDRFHDELDEFQRAMAQLVAGAIPATETFGKAANEEARKIRTPMKRSELDRRGKEIAKELKALEALANGTPGLEELDPGRKIETMPEFVVQSRRTIARLRVLTDRSIGLGPMFTPAMAEVKPFWDDVLKLEQATNGLDREGLTAKSEDVSTYEEWLAASIADAKNLGKTAPVWKSAECGRLGDQCVELLASLDRSFRRLASKLPKESELVERKR